MSSSSSVQLTIRHGSILEFCYDRNPQRAAIVNAANQQCLGGGGLDAAINKAGGKQLRKDREALPVLRNHNTRHEVRCPKGEARVTGPGNYDSLRVPYVIHAVGADYRLVSHPQQGDSIVESAYRSSMDLAEQLQLEAIAFPLLSTGAFRGNQDIRDVVKIGMKVFQSCPNMHLKHIYVYAFHLRDFDLLQSLAQELSLAPKEISYSISEHGSGHVSAPLSANAQPSAPPAPTAPSSTIATDLSGLAILPPPVAVPAADSSPPTAMAVAVAPSAPPTMSVPSAPPASAPIAMAVAVAPSAPPTMSAPSAPPASAPGYNAAVYSHTGGFSPSPLRGSDIAQLKLVQGNFHALIRHEAQKRNVKQGYTLPNLIDLASRDDAPTKGKYYAIKGMGGGFDTQLIYNIKTQEWTVTCETWIKADQGPRPKHSISKDGIQSIA